MLPFLGVSAAWRSPLFANVGKACVEVDPIEPVVSAGDLGECIDLIHGARAHILLANSSHPREMLAQYVQSTYRMVGGEIDLDAPYLMAYEIPLNFEQMDERTFETQIVRVQHPFLGSGPRGVPAGNIDEAKHWSLIRAAALENLSGFTWTDSDHFHSTAATAANSEQQGQRKHYISLAFGGGEDGYDRRWVASCGFQETRLLGYCFSPDAKLAHISDVTTCVDLTQEAIKIGLSQGAEAMRRFTESTYRWQDANKTNVADDQPYMFLQSYPANSGLPLPDVITNRLVETYTHPFISRGPAPAELLQEDAPGRLYYFHLNALKAFQKQPSAFAYSMTNTFNSVDANDADGYSFDATKPHVKHILQVLMKGVDGRGYFLPGKSDASFFLASCGFAETGTLGPTEPRNQGAACTCPAA